MMSDSPILAVAKRPQHIAIIMDGNGRWAKQHKQSRAYGHQQGLNTAKKVIEYCIQYEIPYLTLFAFSSENWQRPASETKWLMRILKSTIRSELSQLMEQGVRCRFLGRLDRIAGGLAKELTNTQRLTEDNSKLNLQIAFDYGGRWDIVTAAQQLAQAVARGKLKPEDITESMFEQALSTMEIPDPDLFIRTGKECRMSNFLLWQLAYSECYFPECYWPDFDESVFRESLEIYAKRERRFGKIEAPTPAE